MAVVIGVADVGALVASLLAVRAARRRQPVALAAAD